MLREEKLEMQKRFAKLKSDAIKRLKDLGTYKGPQDIVVDSDELDPKKDKIKTEIKISTAKFKNYINENNKLSIDLGLDEIFSDEAKDEEKTDNDEDIEIGEIDSLLNSLTEESDELKSQNLSSLFDDEETDDESPEHEADETPEEEASEDEDYIRDGSGPHGQGNGPGKGKGCSPCGEDESEPEDEDEIPADEDVDEIEISSETTNCLKGIIEDIDTIKVRMLTEDMAEELESVFNFKEDDDGDDGVDVPSDFTGVLDKNENNDVLDQIDELSNILDNDLNDEDVELVQRKMDNLFKEVYGDEDIPDDKSLNTLESLFQDDELSLESCDKNNEEEMDDMSELKSLFADENDGTDEIDISEDDITI